jgi:LPPG:FO 2-phospho-L-lactate transferase
MITVLAGGVGAARYLTGLIQVVDPGAITAVVNTADDTVLHGLHISPDLDTVTYTLAGAIDPERGWGLRGETWRAMEALARFTPHRPPNSQAGGTWFNLGDADLATHLYRTARRAEGAPLGAVTAEIAAAFELGLTLLPMTDDRVATMVTIVDPDGDGIREVVREVSFQEYFVQRRHSVPVTKVRFAGSVLAAPAPGVLDALADASTIVIAPSNPVVSIGPIRSLSDIEAALTQHRDRVVAVSPIVGGAALKGPADRMMVELGYEASVVGVARIYAPICATLIIDTVDAHLADAVRAQGLHCIVADTVMRTPQIAADLARITIGGTPA